MLLWESPADGRAGLRQTGLVRWLVGGNSAKVGAGLMLLAPVRCCAMRCR